MTEGKEFTWSHEQQEILDFPFAQTKGQIISAGAGTGKTTVIVEKIRRILEKKPTARITAVSFTNKSAEELSDRIFRVLQKLTPPGSLQSHWITTLHQLCGNILCDFPEEARVPSHFRILDETQSNQLWSAALESIYFDSIPREVTEALDFLLIKIGRQPLEEVLKECRERAHLALDFNHFVQSLDSPHLVSVLRYVQEIYEREKFKQQALDFTDLEAKAFIALQFQHVRSYYHSRFDSVFIDEAQDLNRCQFEILKLFCRPGMINAFFVGDLKQSIYRFRGADLSVFSELLTSSSLHRSKLTINRRSHHSILEATNTLCAPLFQEAIEYEPLIPPTMDESSAPKSYVFVSEQEVDEFADTLLKFRRGTTGRVVILCRSVSSLTTKYWSRFRAKGIKLVIQKGSDFYADPRPLELLQFLKAWYVRGSNRDALGFLMSPCVNANSSWIHSRFESGLKEQDLIDEFRALQKGVDPIATHLAQFERTNSSLDVFVSLLDLKDFSEEYGYYLLYFWHRISDLMREGLSIQEAVLELERESGEERFSGMSISPEDLQDAIEVMTVHSSKGLEFDGVVLVDFGKPVKVATNRLPHLIFNIENRKYVIRSFYDSDDLKKSQETVYLTEMNAIDAESRRLFYVALTRAKSRMLLHVMPLEEKPTKDPQKEDSAKNWRTWFFQVRDKLFLNSTESEELSGNGIAPRNLNNSQKAHLQLEADIPQGRAQKREHLRVRPRHSVSEWTLMQQCHLKYAFLTSELPFKQKWQSFKREALLRSLREKERTSDLDESWFEGDPLRSEASVETPKAPVRQRNSFGTRLHRVLENPTLEDLQDLSQEIGEGVFSPEAIWDWYTQSPFMAAAQDSGMVSHSEFSFEVPVLREQVLLGSMDRVVFHPQQHKAFVFDFKLTDSRVQPSDLLLRYGTQMNLYVAATRRIDPSITSVEAFLVQFDSHHVKEVPVPILSVDLDSLADQAFSILNSPLQNVAPNPGYHCKYCPFSSICPAQTQLQA